MKKRTEPKKRGRKPKGTATALVKTGLPKDIVPKINTDTLSKLVLRGDLSGLTPEQKMEYYMSLCGHLGLDPVTRPFDILNIRGREIMYAHKGCTDQLRKKYGVSIMDIRGEMVESVYRVTAIGRDHTGRTDAATGVVSIGNLRGDDLANAIMKAETKAKRRLTLSLCGLGMLDESEIETIQGAEIKAVFDTPEVGPHKETNTLVADDIPPVPRTRNIPPKAPKDSAPGETPAQNLGDRIRKLNTQLQGEDLKVFQSAIAKGGDAAHQQDIVIEWEAKAAQNGKEIF
jgi:hypothetical protein